MSRDEAKAFGVESVSMCECDLDGMSLLADRMVKALKTVVEESADLDICPTSACQAAMSAVVQTIYLNFPKSSVIRPDLFVLSSLRIVEDFEEFEDAIVTNTGQVGNA